MSKQSEPVAPPCCWNCNKPKDTHTPEGMCTGVDGKVIGGKMSWMPYGESVAPVAQTERCKDCDDCARHAYSDATTPGFFYDKCEKHRKPKAEPPLPVREPRRISLEEFAVQQNRKSLGMDPQQTVREAQDEEEVDLSTPYFLEDHQEALLWLEEHGYVKDSSNQWWQAEEEHAQVDCAIAEFIAGTKEDKGGRDRRSLGKGSLRSPANGCGDVDGERCDEPLKPVPEPQQDTPGQAEEQMRLAMRFVWSAVRSAQEVKIINKFGIINRAQISNSEMSDLHETPLAAWLDAAKRLGYEPTPVQDGGQNET